MPPSTLLAEAIGHLDLLTPEGVQECQLLVHYRLVEYVVSVYRLIRVDIDEPTAMMQTVDSICEYASATCKEISEYAGMCWLPVNITLATDTLRQRTHWGCSYRCSEGGGTRVPDTIDRATQSQACPSLPRRVGPDTSYPGGPWYEPVSPILQWLGPRDYPKWPQVPRFLLRPRTYGM